MPPSHFRKSIASTQIPGVGNPHEQPDNRRRGSQNYPPEFSIERWGVAIINSECGRPQGDFKVLFARHMRTPLEELGRRFSFLRFSVCAYLLVDDSILLGRGGFPAARTERFASLSE
jgi:hypothetical protein